MRLKLMLAAAVLIGGAFPAAAQDLVVTQVLQRVCIPAVTGRSWEQATWTTVEANARALNLTLDEKTANDYGEGWAYSLRQPAGTYTTGISSAMGSVTCTIDAPATVSKARLEQAVTQAIGDDWSVAFTAGGPVWSKAVAGSGGTVGRKLTLNITESAQGKPQVYVRSVADSPF